MFKHCKELPFEETPNYKLLHDLLERVFKRFKLEYDFRYDWLNPAECCSKMKPLNFLGLNIAKNKKKKSSEKITLSDVYDHRNTNMNENMLVLRKKTMQLYTAVIIL